MRPSGIKLHAALLSVGIIYALSYTLAKEVMPEHILPRSFILLRVLGALVFISIFHFVFVKERVSNFKDLAYMAACAFFGVALNMVIFFEGLARTSPVHASLIMVVTPILVLLIGFLIKSEKITLFKIGGIVLGTIGAVLLITSAGKNDKSATVLGDIMIMINASSYAVYLVMMKPLMKKYHTMTITLWTFVFGVMWILSFDIFASGPSAWAGLQMVEWNDFTPYLWGCVIFIVFCTTFLAYVLNAWALQYVKASVLGSYVYVQPVLASMVAVLSGKYAFHLQLLIYAVMIFAGVYLVSKKSVELPKT